MNYVIDIYSDTDNCCYKICRPEAKCETNVYGCEKNEDCQDGLYCNIEDNHCRDINECDIKNGLVDGLIYCGNHVDCVNHDKYYDCNCKSGFTSFIEFEGCSDINECQTGGHNCDSDYRENCINTVGSFICVCASGYTGDPAGTCTDLDECRMGTHDCLPLTYLNAESSYLNEWQFHDYDLIQLTQSAYTLEFDVSSTGTCSISVGTNETYYEIEITEGGKGKVHKTVIGNKQKLTEKTMDLKSKLQGINYVHYYVHFVPGSSSMQVTFGAHDQDEPIILSVTDSAFTLNPVEVHSIGFKSLEKEAFWRNVQLAIKGEASKCVNTIGSYLCSPKDSSNIAIGFGGHTRANSEEYPSELQVITDKVTVCGSHNIPPLSRKIWRGGLAVLDSWLYACGGRNHGDKFPTSVCFKYNLKTIGGSWVSAPSMPNNFIIHGSMVNLGNSIYVIGGEYFGETLVVDKYIPVSNSLNSNYEFNHNTNYWTSKAVFPPYAIHNAGILVDEEDRRIWIFGGHTMGCCHRSRVYYYLVDQNTWHHHSDLPYESFQNTCAMIYSKDDYKRMVCAIGNQQKTLWWYGLENNGGWHHMGKLRHGYKQKLMAMISMDRYNALLVGGDPQLNAHSTKNLWVFDIEDNRFYEKYHYLQTAAKGGIWTTAKKTKNHLSLQNCQSESRTYAAVGWGGFTSDSNDYRTNFHVFLRFRRSGDPGIPLTCHGVIPDIGPGKRNVLMTAVGYTLILCGGITKENVADNKCFKFETNKPRQEWQEIDQMIQPSRVDTVMLTYADAAYAISGWSPTKSKLIESVERWTASQGWTAVASLPKGINQGCGVSDERYGNLFFGGGRDAVGQNEKMYRYDISKDDWNSFGNPKSTPGDRCGATIIEKRGTGHLMLLLVGNNKNTINYLDLTDYHKTGSKNWKSMTSSHSSLGSKLISLSSHEAIEASIHLLS